MARRASFNLNFDTINLLSKNNIVNGLPKLKFIKDHLCSSCELGKAKRKSFHTKTTPSSKRRLQLLHMDLCGPLRSEGLYMVFLQETRMIVETIHVNFDELPHMASDHVSSDPGPQCSTTVLEQDSLSPGPQSQENVPQVADTITTLNELELLYSPMFSELLNGNSPVVSKFSAVHAANNLDKRQQHNTTHTSTTTDVCRIHSIEHSIQHNQTSNSISTVTAPEKITQAKPITKNATF
ncbi:hypothetical protein Tco_1123185 [Tanacetum coccineum]|uniref:Gag-Pol polyprotein n=1 Tax=Tanacetum coccineum TaxID=301880 RepID=A0ABQ5J4A9_9ASTR